MPLPPDRSLAYFGTPAVARDTLALLLERGFTPKVVITSPDAPRGRGLALTPSPTKVFASSNGIPILTPDALDTDAIEQIKRYGCDYALCVAYGKIFPEELIRVFPLGVLNIHYSLLPKYRGATPLESALLAGESETGITIQKMAAALDAGDIIAQQTTPIAPFETARELRPRLVKLGAALLADTLPAYLSGEIVPTPQDESRASRTRKLKKEDGLLDLAAPARENWNTYRAFTDSIGTYVIENGKRMKITAASLRNGSFTIERVIPEGKKERAYTADKR
ncbi:methionyl-tRNA formyltransferase [Patescibacteria group bacterium]|nr:methionyl-tRNA formyltransferase [Patescibacteria group bacterium]